jgi:predicted dehydrogenase
MRHADAERTMSKAARGKGVVQNVGVIGCGAISGAYLSMAAKLPMLRVIACADLDNAKAKAAARAHGIERVCTPDQLLRDPDVQIVLNLTVPKAHLPVALAAIEHGKHTYCEKPLGIDREQGRKLLAAAAKKKLRIGCAPDTFMGAGLSTARKLIDEGAIGRPVAFTAAMMCPGHESWHPSPEFYYEPGGGPMLDMGPYYLTALLCLLGPVKRLAGLSTIAIAKRTITSKKKFGKTIDVKTDDHVIGIMEFTGGASGTIVTSFATHHAAHSGKHPIVIFGTEGTMKVPDPNKFDGTVELRKIDDEDWQEVPDPFTAGYERGVGLADMAAAITTGRAHRASGQMGMAVLDLMQGFLDSSREGTFFTPTIRFERPAAMRADLPFGQFDP